MDKSLIAPYIRPLEPIPTGMVPSGGLRRNLKAVVFDIYGTLFISGSGGISAHGAAGVPKVDFELLLTRYRIPGPGQLLQARLEQAIRQAHEGLGSQGVDHPEIDIRRIWRRLLPELEGGRLERFAVEYEMIANPVYPMPWVWELLAACHGRHLALGIISNAQFYTPYLFPWFLGRSAAQLGFKPDLVKYSFQQGRAKPSPAMFREVRDALEAKKIPCGTALYVGNDMENDMGPAAALGFQTALFAGDQRSLRLRGASPEGPLRDVDLVITDLGQLIDHIQGATVPPCKTRNWGTD